jgi:GrpB-like predicted nucleotidyltransferase (UPF0157 family)
MTGGDERSSADDAARSGEDVEPWVNAPDPPDALGVARGTVELVAHQEAFRDAFEREAERLRDGLGSAARVVEHVGSTAVRELPAKPIVDVAVGVPDLETARDLRDRGTVRDLGYAYREGDDVPDRLFFARGPPECRTFYVSLAPVDGETLREQVAFRDALRANEALREEYTVLKRDLAAAHGDDRERYTAAKGDFVERVLVATDRGPTE